MDIFVLKIEAIDEAKKFKKKEIFNSEKLIAHCFAYYMLDKILDEFYNIEEREIIYRAKKPHLKSNKKQFCISHSGEYVALALSDYPCGIDIEKNNLRNFSKIAQRMKFKSLKEEDFYPQWTEFEAQYKLGYTYKTIFTTNLSGYTLTAVSSNQNETFILKNGSKILKKDEY